jgi:glycosyltransferase involved in cell wall biosynthesis
MASVKRLACYGWVEPEAGSVASADYLILKELLRRGIEIDFYANRQHVPHPPGLDCDGFRYFGFAPPVIDRALPPRIAGSFFWPLVSARWRGIFGPVAEARHREVPYDAMLSLGTWPAFTVSGVPVVTWVQGPLHTELEAIRRLRRQIWAMSGRAYYLAMVAYYVAASPLRRGVLDSSSRVICGSEWARRAIASRGISLERIYTLPYPIDLDLFQPREPRLVDWESPLLLHLGRLDPRKRLDLLLGGFSVVLRSFPRARLRIIGRSGHARNAISLIERFPQQGQVEYVPQIPRTSLPKVLRETAVLVQTSENENFGSSVAQALPCGVPAVVGPSNGTGDYVDETSEIFDAYTPESAGAAIVRVLERRREKPDLVRHSTRAAAERWFTLSTVVDRLLDIVDGAIDDATELAPESIGNEALTAADQ